MKLIAVALVVAVLGIGGKRPRPPATLLAAGDVASCSSTGDEATATLLTRTKGTIAALGDLAYEQGTGDEFARCYGPSWGRFRSRTRPVPGNHEYGTPGAAPYFAYFGARAGPAGRGWYSYTLGNWHVVALNSNCADAGGCQTGSPQQLWLARDLAMHPAKCTLAYWHHTLFSSGAHGDDAAMADLFRTLYRAGAEIVLTAHDHDYERFAPQTPTGVLEPRRGVRVFVVGTGGRSHTPLLRAPSAASRVRDSSTYGVLKLTLAAGRYAWRFLPADGSFTDAGTTACH